MKIAFLQSFFVVKRLFNMLGADVPRSVTVVQYCRRQHSNAAKSASALTREDAAVT